MQNDPNFKTRQILNSLLEWAEHTGGWDAPVWDEARVYRDSLLPPEPEAPATKRYRVEGTVHLVARFCTVFEAATEGDARNLAEMWAAGSVWHWPEIQEVCVQSVTEES